MGVDSCFVGAADSYRLLSCNPDVTIQVRMAQVGPPDQTQRQRNMPAIRFALLVVFLLAAPGSVGAQTKKLDVDVELVLLADASNSIDDAEIRFQRQGYATAITHPDVLSAIAKGDRRRIAVTFIEWGDLYAQKTVVPWTVIRDKGSAKSFADKLLASPRLAYGSNAIGEAINAAQKQIEANRFEGYRKVIDLSADSANSWNGMSIEEARKKALAAGIIINGLAVLCRAQDCSGRPVAYDLEKAFAERIIGGPGSFVITADSTKTFADAVRRKLILELAGLFAGRSIVRR
jgi:Protein of unknown function (DUF1194)